MEHILAHICDFIKQFEVKAQNKQTKSAKRWLLNKEYLEPASDSDEDETPKKTQPEPKYLERKVKCIYEAAKYGTQEGVLAGVFFGGSWGIFRFISLRPTPNSSVTEKESQSGRKFNVESNKGSYVEEQQSQPPRSRRLVKGNEDADKNKSGFVSDDERQATERSESAPKSNGESAYEVLHGSETSRKLSSHEKSFLDGERRSSKNSNTSQASQSHKSNENVEFIGYAFIQTGSFDDSDGRQSDDPDPSKSVSNQSEKKKSEESSEKSTESSKEHSIRSGSQSTSRQASKSPSKSSATKNSEDLGKQLGRQYSARSAAGTSSAGHSVVALRNILDTQDVSKSSGKNSKTSSTTPKSSGPSTDSDVGQSVTSKKHRLTFDSKNAFSSPVAESNASHETKASETATESFEKQKDEYSQRGKSPSVSSKQKSSRRLTSENIWPGRDISKSILRNADSLSNSYFSMTMSSKSGTPHIDQDEGKLNEEGTIYNASNISEIGSTPADSKKVRITESDVSASVQNSRYGDPEQGTPTEQEVSDSEPIDLPQSLFSGTLFGNNLSSAGSDQIDKSQMIFGNSGTTFDNKVVSTEKENTVYSSANVAEKPPRDQSPIEKETASEGGTPEPLEGPGPESVAMGTDPSGATFRSLSNAAGLDKSTSSFIQKVGPSSDESSRSSSVVKSGAQSTIRGIAEKDGNEDANNFNFLSAVNDNIIILSACNCALVLGFICGVISTTKASLSL